MLGRDTEEESVSERREGSCFVNSRIAVMIQ